MSDILKTIKPNPPANFTPDLSPYKPLQPFRFWCQKVLPLVYDDSLSYYELLCKVVHYLNVTMTDVESLHTDVNNLYNTYILLQKYVNDYFKNLDVQEEINKKLDEMAKDGTLSDLMGRFMVRVYDTFDDATKNIPNITYRVLGRHKINDGGESVWKTSLVEPKNVYYEKYGEVYHELIQTVLNVVSCGCVDSDGNIDVDKLNSLRPRNGIFFPAGYYYADKTILVHGSIHGTPVSLPQINHESSEIGSWRTASNAVIDSTANPIIQVNDSCIVENIVVRGHSYYQTEHRELARQGNNQPIYSRFRTGEQVGIYLHDYGSRATGCSVYYCQSGIKVDYYGKVNDCYVFECEIGYYILANDSNIINCRCYDCYNGFYITGALNTIINTRCDGISNIGLILESTGSDVFSFACDFAYKCAIRIIGDYNTVISARYRCCAQYPSIDTPINDDNASGNCAVLISGHGNKLISIPSKRPNIMDSGEPLYSMNKIVGLTSGSTFTDVDFIECPRSDTKLIDLIQAVSGNAPATSFKSIWQYYGSSFTYADDVNVLICNNYANTKQTGAPKGTVTFDGANWFIWTGTKWKTITTTD